MADILVIDDDPVILQLLQRLLREQGYTVATAASAEIGMALAADLSPPVIICDWRLLPGEIDGIEVCQRIKQDPQLAATFFLLLTGHTAIANRVQALEAGADDLLIKPVDIAELKARVKSGLRLHELAHDLQRQKQRLEAELKEAADYVRSLLPRDMRDRVRINARFFPSRQLGGDCFDYYWLDPDYLMIYLLDVSGHGLGAALLSTSVLNVLRSQSLPDVNFYRPEKVLAGLNEMFQMDGQNDKYFTIWYGVYNQATRQLVYASAGHPPAVLLTDRGKPQPQIERLRTSGMPIGMMPESTYAWERCQIPPDSRLYLFSDGVYEVQQENQELLGLEGFIQLLRLAQADTYPSLDWLLQQIEVLRIRNTVFSDDLSLLEVNFG
ncbi:SpoIIE family protein phosphatase [Romeria aff. gracilis LEGE 07310]|uniref:SpoIIE family protein phosphatase n=1 Tax=Vasconcelosia minhoensis LEGE 07310 TaxID=915328 RepID=A0A8J7AII4_9CYAN|nr:SpoIIE family protein phosphatase [Romeria gracilis]MBE9079604.1 SpoIIE family protein phosphatase [Romeria aff. gracilis LEGE 07310]